MPDIDYSKFPDPKTASCVSCLFSTMKSGDNSTRLCHFDPLAHPATAQRPNDWWCSAYIPKKKKMAEVPDED